jgi:putative ABC transport system substrate-binding protein
VLRELIPGLVRIAILGNAANPYSVLAVKHVTKIATSVGVSCEGINLDEAGGLEGGLERLRGLKPQGVLVPGVPVLLLYRERITAFMAANRIPAVYPWPEFVEVGGLVVYSTNFDDLFRRAAGYVDRILRGAPPGELPVQQATTFQFVINMRAAMALGLTVPQSILARADEVIE